MTALATLVLELALTRIFSVVFYYHFAFLAISIALFGLGAGGVFSYVAARWRGSVFSKLGAFAALNAIFIVAALAVILLRPAGAGVLALAIVYFLSAVPFFFAGAILSLAISETIDRVDRVYFFDLIGAAGGCFLLIPLLNSFGGANTVIAAAALFAASSAVWHNVAGRAFRRAAGVALALLLVGLLGLNLRRPFIDVRYAKGTELANEIFVKWNSFSRISVVNEAGSDWKSIVIDADASTGIPRFDLDRLSEQDRFKLLHDGPGLVYCLRPGAKTLVIGPGGGWDVARALASGSRSLTGVEINPIIANTIMRQRFPELSRGLYLRPEVRIVVEDGRSFVRRTREKYQVIQATLVDTWASTAAGAFALSENNLYTTDAFLDYLSHLTEDGILIFTRWGFEPPRESLRLLSLARVALERLGETEVSRHVIVVRENAAKIHEWGATDTVLVARKPFSAADLERTRQAAAAGGLQVVYLPGESGGGAFAELLKAPDLKAFAAAYPYDVSPVSDDRPFFFYTVQPRDIRNYLAHAVRASADFKINRAVPLLFGLVGVSLAATVVILALPPLILGTRLPREKGVLRFLWYFMCLGAGYILIQVALIQKFVLFLGHPTYALTVIIFSMLLASGLGSFWSRRLGGGSDGKLARILVGIAALVTALAFASGPLTKAGIGLPLPVKMLVTALAIAPAAFLMGMPFPLGLSRLERIHKPSIRWAWSLNAASSVLGSTSAILLAIYFGLKLTLLAGGLLYVLAVLSVRMSRSLVKPLGT
jgi:spermidine synthase